MAHDPNEELPGLTGMIEDPSDFPDKLPSGVEKTKDWYAFRRTYANGRQVWQFFKRNSGGGPVGEDGKPGDRVFTTSETVIQGIADKFKEAEAKGDQEGDIRPSSGPTREVYRDGKWVVEPNPVYQAPAAQNPNAPANRNEAILQQQRERNAALPGPNPNGATEEERRGQDPRYETDQERAERAAATIKEQGAAARQAQIDAQNAANVAADNKRADAEAAQRAAQTNKPDVHLTQDGTQAVITYPDGRVETKPTGLASAQDIKQDKDDNWVATGKDAQGNPTVRIVPVQGQTSQGAGPPLPELILGHSQDALRAYRQSLQVEVDTQRHTQAWADARWKEALEVAQHVINEATILHADQQSNMNASINLANSRLAVANSGFNSALDFVSKMKTGDSSGGAAFGALLTLQLANAQRAGGYDNIVPGSQGSMEGRGVGDATASTFATTNDQLTRLTAPPATTSAAAAAAPTPSTASPPSASPPPPSEPVIPPSAPATPATAAAPAPPAAAVPPPTPGEPGGPPLQPGPVWTPPAAQAAPPVPAPAGAPDYGTPGMSVLPGVVSPAPVAPEPTPEASPGAPPEEMVTIRNRVTGATMTLPRSKWNSTWTLGIWQEVSPEAPAPASPDVGTNAPYNEDPSQGPVGQVPYADWAVMAKAMPQQQSVTPAFTPSPTAPDAMPYAILHSQAASRPWWRMTPEEEERYRAAGVPEETIRSNGRTVAA